MPHVRRAALRLGARSRLVRAGDVYRAFAILERGTMRVHSVSEAGKEVTRFIRGPGDTVGPLADLLLNRPSQVFFQALTPTEFLVAHDAPILERAKNDVFAANLLRRNAELDSLDGNDQAYALQTLSADERSQRLIERGDEWVAKIPRYYVASYLGVTPEALSWLRRRRRGR